MSGYYTIVLLRPDNRVVLERTIPAAVMRGLRAPEDRMAQAARWLNAEYARKNRKEKESENAEGNDGAA